MKTIEIIITHTNTKIQKRQTKYKVGKRKTKRKIERKDEIELKRKGKEKRIKTEKQRNTYSGSEK